MFAQPRLENSRNLNSHWNLLSQTAAGTAGVAIGLIIGNYLGWL